MPKQHFLGDVVACQSVRDHSRIDCLSVLCARRSLAGLELFPHLEEVILDSNGLTDSIIESLPTLHKVHSLSLNKNKISFMWNDVGLCI